MLNSDQRQFIHEWLLNLPKVKLVLNELNVLSTWSLLTAADFVCYFLTFTKVIEAYTGQRGFVEEQVLPVCLLNKSETLVHNLFNLAL